MGKCGALNPKDSDKLFFPDAGRTIRGAKEFCADCPVINICLEQALINREHGVWAGTNEKERRAILRFRELSSRVPKKVIRRSGFALV